MIKWIYTCPEEGTFWEEKLISAQYPENDGRKENGTSVQYPCLIRIDSGQKRQRILGFGGAFTDTAAAALSDMPAQAQEEVVKAYFDPVEGLGYNVGRIPIGASDFASVPYDCMGKGETGADISQDKKGIIPLINKSKGYMSDDLLLYVLPWSPPALMKTNGVMTDGGKLKPDCFPAMAKYLADFVEAYEKEGIPIWGIAPQNEPVEVQRWSSCVYSGPEEQAFLRDYLIPELDRRGHREIKYLFWDCNKDEILPRVREVLADEGLRDRLFGVAFHWYSGDFFDSLECIHQDYPQLALLATEACIVMPKDLATIEAGERYAHAMIGDLKNWTSMWIDWNLYLNEKSGPAIVYNPCAAPIILDTRSGRPFYMTSYYYIGHFSRYIRRDAFALCSEEGEEPEIESCAFQNPDGSIVCVLLNRSNRNISGTINLGTKKAAVVALEAHSIGTCVIGGESNTP